MKALGFTQTLFIWPLVDYLRMPLVLMCSYDVGVPAA